MKNTCALGALIVFFFCQPVRSALSCDPKMQLPAEYDQCLSKNGGLNPIIERARVHDIEAIQNLADHYLLFEEDRLQGEKWLRKGAQNGSTGMAFTLGSLLTSPDRTKVEQAEGEALLLPLAERGNLSAQTELGYFYEEQGNPLAAWWFERAAWRGDTGGMSQLADHLAGSSVCVDRWQAIIWYQVAAKFFTKGSWAQRDVSTKADRLLGVLQCAVPFDADRLSKQYVSAIRAFKEVEGQ